MKLNYFKSISLLFTFLFCVANPARAALITTEFSELVGNQGSVEINLSLASGENFSGFSLYFSETLFANLDIIFSPAAWDSLVVQPDALLGAGLFDSYNPAGLSSGVARVSFTYLSTLPFDVLAYDFYDADFSIVESGSSTNVTTPVPESSSIILLLLGLIAVALRQSTKRQQVAA
ncbi:MAG TPA: PEP-CTERM sorting domain-containing protein [Cellvibrio sp.]